MYDAQLAFFSSAYNECNQQNNSKLEQEQSKKVNEDNMSTVNTNNCTPNPAESTLHSKAVINNKESVRQKKDGDDNSESDESGDGSHHFLKSS